MAIYVLHSDELRPCPTCWLLYMYYTLTNCVPVLHVGYYICITL